MSNKQNINEIALSTAENIADELIFKSATTFVEDLAKSVPVASVVLGLTKAISNYKTAKDQRQLLAFIQETENINNGFIEKFFKDKDNTELGYEILGILDQTYLQKQARMIGRTTVLFKNLEISKQDFDKFTYIITKLNQHLFSQIIQLNDLYNENIDFEGGASVPFLNMDFISFGFVERRFEPSFGDSDLLLNFKNHEYLIQNEFIEFYEKIFKD
ncbi:hypothetical protein [Acinetobacter sp. BSP-28]|uniref:hypothetical protein n=1 Tax=Acinetobacter sp. BSP-28 TaxID=3344661 RepID=UPI0037703272